MASFLETLLALNRAGIPPMPEPAQPMQIMPSGPMFAPPNPIMPQPAAPVGLPPLDQNLIAQIAGPPPVQQQPSFLDKLGAVLSGIGAGPQYGMQLREQRERPQREYQQRRLAGTEVALRRQEQQQAEQQRRADSQSERQFQVWLKKTGVEDAEAKEKLRQAFEIQKIRELERIADEKQQTQIKAANDKQARGIAAELISKEGAPPNIADNLSQHIVNGTPLSPAAEKFRSVQANKALAQIARLQRLTGGGEGSGGGGFAGASKKAVNAVKQFEAAKQKYVEAVATGNARGKEQGGLELRRLFRALAKFPEIETGYDQSGQYPYAKIRTPQGSIGLVPQQAASPTNVSPQPTFRNRAEAKAMLMREGYSDSEADNELNYLGIK